MLKLSVHLGSHKTGTTYLQNLLGMNVALLRANGVGFLPVGTLRVRGMDILRRPGEPDRITRRLEDLFFNGSLRREVIVYSDENLLGTCPQMLKAKALYPEASRKVQYFSPIKMDKTFYLAVRSQATFLTSVWAEGIRATDYVDFSSFFEEMVRRRPSWVDVVKQIKDEIGSSRLVVWRYEDQKDILESIISLLSSGNISYNALDGKEFVAGRPSMSMQGYELLKSMDEVLGRDVVRMYSKTVATNAVVDKSHGPIEALPPESQAYLDQLYAEDIAKIATMTDIVFLRPAANRSLK